VPALIKPGCLESFAQPLDAHLVRAALANDAYTSDAGPSGRGQKAGAARRE
jgi:hypothetical protein